MHVRHINSFVRMVQFTKAMNQPPPAFHIMVKPRGAICNLDCQYCFYLKKENLYPKSSFRMSDEVLENYTRQYIEAQQVPEVVFAWQGGEPTLMGLDFFRKAVAFQEKYKKPGMRVQNALQTNGTLLNEEWCQFFHDHHFLIGISLDGPRALHDAYRVDKGGNPTFDRVMRAVELMKAHGVEFNVLACVNAVTAREPLAVYRFFRDEVGAKFIQFIPIVERQNSTGFQEGELVTERSVTGRAYGRFLNAIFDEWVRHDVAQVYVQIFDVALAAWAGYRPGLCIFEETCGQALAIEHNGDLYSCDHYVEPGYRLGNMMERPLADLVGSEAQQKFGRDKRDSLPRYCRECPVRFVCNGGCPKNRILRTPPSAGSEPGLNYLCEGYKGFFTHIDQPMKTMAALLAQQRAPAEIMQTLPPLEAEGEKRRRHKKR